MMDAVGKDIDTNAVRPVPAPQVGIDASPSTPLPPGADAVAVGANWHPKTGFRGAALSLYMGSAARTKLEAGEASLSGDAALHSENASLEPQLAFSRFGGLENDIALDAWRGKRVRVTLRLKDQEDARAYVMRRSTVSMAMPAAPWRSAMRRTPAAGRRTSS